MSKELTLYAGLKDGERITPENFDKYRAKLPANVRENIAKVFKLFDKDNKNAFDLAYILATLSAKSDKKKHSDLQMIGYKDAGELADACHWSSSTAYAYAQTATAFLVKDEHGTHSKFCSWVASDDSMIPDKDFTLSQLQELRPLEYSKINALIEDGMLDYNDTTKKIRFVVKLYKEVEKTMEGKEPAEIVSAMWDAYSRWLNNKKLTVNEAIKGDEPEKPTEDKPTEDKLTEDKPTESNKPTENAPEVIEKTLEEIMTETFDKLLSACKNRDDCDMLRIRLEYYLDDVAMRVAELGEEENNNA